MYIYVYKKKKEEEEEERKKEGKKRYIFNGEKKKIRERNVDTNLLVNAIR